MRAMRFAIAAVFLAVSADRSDASFLTFTSRSAFEAAITGEQTIGFEGLATPNWYTSFNTGLTLGGVSFTRDPLIGTSSLFVAGPGNNSHYFTMGETLALVATRGVLNIAVGPGTNAIGFDLSTNEIESITVTNSGGDVVVIPTPHNPGNSFYVRTRFFYGFITTTPFATISITNNQPTASQGILVMDNFSTGMARASSVTPEPTSMALAGFAGVGMAIGAWRRRRQQARLA